MSKERELLNDFCIKVQEGMLDFLLDHGRHASFCNKINDIKSEYLEKIEAKPLDNE